MDTSPPNAFNDTSFRLRWTLARKIGGLAAVLILLLVLVAAYSAAKLRSVGREIEEITRRDLAAKRATRRVEWYQLNQNVAFERATRHASESGEEAKLRRDEGVADFERFSALFHGEMQKAESICPEHTTDPADLAEYAEFRDLLGKLKAEHRVFEDGGREILRLDLTGKAGEARALAEKLEKNATEMEGIVGRLFEAVDALIEKDAKDAARHEAAARRATAILGALALVAGVLLSIALVRRITRSVAAISEKARSIAVGITNDRLEEGKLAITSSDEVGLLCVAFNQMLESLVCNIADRKQAEDELRQMNLVLENAVEGISRLDTRGRYLAANRAYAEMLGYRPDEMAGMEWHQVVRAEDLERQRAAYQRMLAKDKADYEAWAVRKDGSLFCMQAVLIKAYDKEGSFAGHYSFMKDITERKQAEQLLLERAALERSNRELEQFSYVVSHDLKEPLLVVEGFGRRLRAKYGESLTEHGRGYLDAIMDGARRMQELIGHLLTLSRAANATDPFVAVDLASTAREVVADLDACIKRTGGRVEVGDLPVVEGDPTQLRQLLQNLIGNALKYHADRLPVVRVHSHLLEGQAPAAAGASPRPAFCRIVVEDNGIGFEEKHLDRIFRPFQRLHSREEYEGTGIGLAICRKIVERHGGLITARSQVGHGSSFIVTLPMHRPAANPSRESAAL